MSPEPIRNIGRIIHELVETMANSVIEDRAPLDSDYLPAEFVNRKEEQSALTEVFSDITNIGSGNLVITGPPGTGKTHFTLQHLQDLPDTVSTCYVNCRQNNTQYKVLSDIHSTLFDEDISDGYHTAILQRELERRLVRSTVIVLDDIDFLLLNDGDNLLYYFSRELPRQVTLVLIVTDDTDLKSKLEERTNSSLHPRQLTFDQYTEEEVFDILAQRARKALAPQSLHREGLRYIATTVSNPLVGLHWLKTAGEAATEAITTSTIVQKKAQAYHRYIDHQLSEFTIHHRLAYQAIQDLTTGLETSARTGQIFDRYQRLCSAFSKEPLSHRRLSDFLKHLELLNIIDVEYHYGGDSGRTREIQLKYPSSA